MFKNNFNDFDHNFCESLIYSNVPHPEYLNSISSLFITFIGLNGLCKLNIDKLHKIFLSSLVINGITSYFYHYYNSIGWGLMDRMSMILIAISSIFTLIFQLDKIIELSNLLESFIYLLIISYFTILLTITSLHMEDIFNMLFGLFLSSSLIYMYLINKHKKKLYIPDEIIKFGWNGIIYIGSSGFFWILTENLCTNIWFIKYLFGHIWWHVFVSYGGYLFSLVSNFLYLKNKTTNNIFIRRDFYNIPYLIEEKT